MSRLEFLKSLLLTPFAWMFRGQVRPRFDKSNYEIGFVVPEPEPGMYWASIEWHVGPTVLDENMRTTMEVRMKAILKEIPQ